ncbi:MAG: hypothetical protein AB7G11_14790, partial [Phycisphaerales bacterium]
AAGGFGPLLAGVLPIPESVTEPGSPANLYNLRVAWWAPKFDQVVHAAGFGVATVTAWYALRATYPSVPRMRHGLWVAVVLMGMGLGAINEVIEFIATRLMPWTNVGGYENTGWDLVSNLVGCATAGVVIAAWGKEGAAPEAAAATMPAHGHSSDQHRNAGGESAVE